MRKILPFHRAEEAAAQMDAKAFGLIDALQSESFEEYEGFDLLAFDWYDVRRMPENNAKLVIYLDKEHLFFFCENDAAANSVELLYRQIENAESLSNEQLLYIFFVRLLKGNMNCLDALEEKINEEEEQILSQEKSDTLRKVSDWRKQLLRLKRYYEQLDVIFDEMSANDNGLLSKVTLKRIAILGTRTDRYLRTVTALQESVNQLCDLYQSQLAIRQNDFMKVFTIVTSVFLPLTLITGWYGMNFAGMPELKWQYGYPCVIAVSLAIAVLLIWYFKKKKWI